MSALKIATASTSDTAAKIRAVRVALTAASDLFEADIGLRAYSVLVEAVKAGVAREADVIEPMMQFNTIFGDLNTALLFAKEIHARRDLHSQSPEGLRLLNNASFVLRVCGDLAAAMQCLTTSESSLHVRESAARLLDNKWRKVVVAFEGNDRRHAIELGRSFAEQSNLPAHKEETWVRLFNLRLEHLTTGKLRAANEALVIAAAHTSTPTRLTLYCTALCLYADEVVADDKTYNAMLERGKQFLTGYGRYSGLDFLASSVIQKLEEAGQHEAAQQLCTRYVGVDRRELSQIGFVFDGLSRDLRQLAKTTYAARRAGGR